MCLSSFVIIFVFFLLDVAISIPQDLTIFPAVTEVNWPKFPLIEIMAPVQVAKEPHSSLNDD